MRKAFLEASAINTFCDRGITGSKIRSILENQLLSPVVGIFTTLELAQTFLTDNAIDTCRKFFNYA